MPRSVGLSLANWPILYDVSRLDEQGCGGSSPQQIRDCIQSERSSWQGAFAGVRLCLACPRISQVAKQRQVGGAGRRGQPRDSELHAG